MNKTAIKNFAVWARNKLITDITYKAGLIGVSEKGIAQPLPQSSKDLQFFDIGTKDYAQVAGSDIEQRNALVRAIQEKERTSDYKTAFKAVIEEVAYTWFNRLIAIRFMEVNEYLPSRIRVLSSENPAKNEPDFVTTPFDTDMEFTKAEQETVINFDNELDTASVYTHDSRLIKKLQELRKQYPEQFILEHREHGSVTYTIPKRCVGIRPPYSEKRREQQRQEAKENGLPFMEKGEMNDGKN